MQIQEKKRRFLQALKKREVPMWTQHVYIIYTPTKTNMALEIT